MKAKALVKCEIKDGKPKKPWRKNPGLMEFLRSWKNTDYVASSTAPTPEIAEESCWTPHN